MTPAQQAALDEYLAATQAYAGQTYGQLTPAEIQETALAGVQYDPKMLEYEMSALRALEEQGREGLTAQDRAAIAAAERQAGQAARGRRGAIEQGMRSRGISGSGLDLVAQLQSAESANELAAMKALEQGALSSQRRTQGQLQAGQMAGQIGTRQYQTAAERAAAQDRIRQFNAQNRMGAQQFNIQAAQQQAANKLGAQQSAAQMRYNAAAEVERARQMREEERKRRRAGGLAAGLGALGAAGGAYFGGPAGAAAGGQLGAGLGQAFSGYADGGLVDPAVYSPPSDTDTVPAFLTPGERVLPRDVANSPDAAAAFVKAQKKAEADIMSAKKARDLLTYGDIGAKLLSDYAGSQTSNVYLPRRMDELGKGPEVFAKQLPQYQMGTLTQLGEAGVAKAKESLAEAKDKFVTATGLEKAQQETLLRKLDVKKQSELLDPNSKAAKTYGLVYQNKLLTMANNAQQSGQADLADRLKTLAQTQGLSVADMSQQLKALENLDIKNPAEVRRAQAEIAKFYQDIEKSKAETSKLQAEAKSIFPTASGQIPSSNLEKLSAIPKEMRAEYLKETGQSAVFSNAVKAATPIVDALASISLQEGTAPGWAGGGRESYQAMKARLAAEVIEKVPGIRSDSDFRNIVEPLLPSPSDEEEQAKFKAAQFKTWLKSKAPATPISDTYFKTAQQTQRKKQGGSSGSWEPAQDYESMSYEKLTKKYNELLGSSK